MKLHSDILRQASHALFLSFLLCLFSILVQPRMGHAQEAVITDFTVANSNSQLSLYLTVTDCFTDEMLTAVHNGIPITFTYYVDIYRMRSIWLDKKIREYKFNHTMEYDSLKKEYTVHLEEKDSSRSTSSLDEAKMIMAEINGFDVLPLKEIAPHVSYTVKAKAKLARKSLPLYFHYLIPFTSLWDFETDWHQLTLRLTQ
jgi:hypothetical protein